MNWRDHCGVVIPCLNEARTIGRVVSEARAHLPTVVVVDDGSGDDTAANARKSHAVVLRHEDSHGKGTALTNGLNWLADRGFAWGLTMDGDGQHAPADIPRFLAAAAETNASLLVGNRMGKPEGMPTIRRWTNRWMSRRISRLGGQPFPDSQCGFRMMRLDVWSALAIQAAHFEIESETLLAYVAAGHQVAFVPVQVLYSGERSKIRPVRDSLRWLRWWARARQDSSRHGLRPRAMEISASRVAGD